MFEKWKTKRKAVLYKRGFDYASGALLAGTPPEEIEAECDMHSHNNHFDHGMQEALNSFHKMFWRLKEK
jgi:hypothetical protein